MQITPAIKGQLTKAIKAADSLSKPQFTAVRQVFVRHMPREQAKHAAKQYLAAASH